MAKSNDDMVNTNEDNANGKGLPMSDVSDVPWWDSWANDEADYDL